MEKPKRIFLTGGTGLLGNNILRLGIQREMEFTVLSRQGANVAALRDLPIQVVQGDLDSAKLLDQAIANCDVIIHSAAHIHIGWKQRDEAMAINQVGTQNIVNAALRHSKPMIHISTVNTLAIGQRDQPANEQTSGDGQIASTYVVSKRAAQQVVDQGIVDGLQATSVYPGFMLAPFDWKPSSGRMIVEIQKRYSPLAPAGGCSVCDARNVAAAILTIAAQERFGQRYILAGENMTYLDLWSRIAKGLGKRPPITILRRPGQWVVSKISDNFLSKHGESDTNSAAISMGSQFHYYDSSKAANELGYTVRPFKQTLADTLTWLLDQQLIDFVGDDDTVVDRAKPAGHDDTDAAGVE